MCLVWDLASRTLVGRLDPLSSNLFDITHKVTRLTVHGRSRHLITWTNHPRFWGVLPLDLRDAAERVVSHEARVVAAVHNCTFDRLLTVDTSGALALPPPACPGLPPCVGLRLRENLTWMMPRKRAARGAGGTRPASPCWIVACTDACPPCFGRREAAARAPCGASASNCKAVRVLVSGRVPPGRFGPVTAAGLPAMRGEGSAAL